MTIKAYIVSNNSSSKRRQATMKNIPRSTALKIAAVLSFLISAFGVIGTIPYLARGATAINQGSDSPPYVVLLGGLITGVVGVVAAYGAWKQQRWGVILTILANLVNGLSAAPGVLFAPAPWLTAIATATVIVSILIIVLCLWRDRQPVTA
jgi:hypothetical protein